jgi:ABC-type multidrug transport system permease subunit
MLTVHTAAPSGQTCSSYAGAFASAVGGYINNPDSTGDCQFCQYSVGDSFYNNLEISFNTRWRDFGIFVSYHVSHARQPLNVVRSGLLLDLQHLGLAGSS